MNLVKILNSLTRIITLMLVLIIVMIVFLAANYEPELPDNQLNNNELAFSEKEAVNLFADDPGYKLFEEWGCGNCHNINSKKIGPALAGVTQRRDREWLYEFIKNSQRMVGNEEPTARDLFDEYNKLPMPNHDLNNEEIDLILAYIEKAAQ